jgi:diaminohydroxyphosphoribosylaminopyrimidine deaminase/5-amino-6-(5-phosphoribosylamino)uracil reductase
MMSVLIEGGGINASALKAGIVDKVVVFIAPMLMTAIRLLHGGISPLKLGHAIRLSGVTSRLVGQDLMIEGYIR